MKTKHTNQNYKQEFENEGYENLTFERIPRTKPERLYFRVLNRILKDLDVSGRIIYEKRWKQSYFDKVVKKRNAQIKENLYIYKLAFYEIDTEPRDLKYVFETEHLLSIRKDIVWGVFGGHYFGIRLRDKMNEVQRLKIDNLRSWLHAYNLRKYTEQLENHIIKVLPLQSKSHDAKVNEFFRIGGRKFNGSLTQGEA